MTDLITAPARRAVVAATAQRRARPIALVGAVVAAAGLPAVVDRYTITLAGAALVLAGLAMSTQLLVGTAGLPAFGQPAYFGAGAYTAALAAQAGITNGPAQLAAAAGAGAVAAVLTAPVVLRTRGTAFLMVTFAVQSLTATAASRWRTVTGGDDGLHTPPITVPAAGALTSPAHVYWYTLAAFLCLCAAVAVLLRSPLGLRLAGCAGQPPRMSALGHPVNTLLGAGYTAAGAVAGASGALLVAVHQYVSPADIGFETAAVTLLAAALGAGTMTGAIAGAVAVVACRDWIGAPTAGHGHALLGLLFLTVAYTRPVTAHARQLFARRSRP
ncbi:branched-chain amino acid ABC transporter permease [Catenuloplanes japonicus]|uniref:branched-chain amino acid ABC transporter permease n=1 Tax=Catenuloplanes japonicus TaxID=33876 RepID=UPI0007C43DF7|nr:branched-chain amino acid ABC transporter permease [Catenuloplanes japonicus]